MVSRKWTNREINEALRRLGTCYELPPERSAALEARIRREVIARYGRFDVPLQSAVSNRQLAIEEESTAPRTGMLVLLPALRSFVSGVGRPAFALAGVAAVAVGAVIAFQRSGWGSFRAQGIRQPVVAPQAEMVAVAAPIVPGSGVAVSVFGVTPLRVRGDEGELRTDRNPSQPPLTLRGGVEVFDEDFFSYKEDVDLAFRLRSAGWTAHVVPSTRAWHDRTAAGPRELTDAAAADLRRSKSPLVRYHSYKNHLLTLVKNEHRENFAWHWPWVVGYELKKLAYVLLRERDTLRALREVWQRIPAMRAKRRAIMAKWRVPPHELRRWFQ